MSSRSLKTALGLIGRLVVDSLVIEDLAYEAKAKAKTSFSRPGQGHENCSRPTSRPTESVTITICIAVTEIYAYLIKHNAKELIGGDFDVQC